MREDEREKLVRNQQLFERANQSIRDLATAARVTAPVTFLCECSDENCRTEIRMGLEEYRRTHDGRGRFVIARGHDMPSIERVVVDACAYLVVEKSEDALRAASGVDVAAGE